MSEFETVWRRHYGDTPALSWAMRDREAGDWLRFHALPRSKRYPDSPEEEQIILERANTLARAVVGEGATCWLAQAGDWEPPFDANAQIAGRFHYDEFDWLLFVSRLTFKSGVFDTLLLAVAKDTALRSLWLNEDTGDVFAPYDGGFDLFLKSPSEVEFLKARHASWLSPRCDGL
ncbi:MAG: hypothetical protein R3C30_11855 [Hyphomonadaceae bacterium]